MGTRVLSVFCDKHGGKGEDMEEKVSVPQPWKTREVRALSVKKELGGAAVEDIGGLISRLHDSEDARTTTEGFADLVQDMYLKELKAYKAPPIKPSDAEGHVQKFAMPKAPASPEEADIASDLKAYEDQVPEIEGQAGSASAPEQDWFEDPDDGEAPAGAAH